jgi:hypothetical protein
VTRVDALFASGRVIDLILVLMAIEGLALGLLYRKTGMGIAPVRLWPNLLAGGFLMLALRAALTGSGSVAIGSWLVLGLIAHLVDLALRWPRHTPRS